MQILLLPFALLLGFFHKSPSPIVLKGYSHCQSSLIEETGDGLTYYARTQRDCQNGDVILAFEKRLSKRSEKAIYQIADTVHIKTSDPNSSLSITNCTSANGKNRQYFVLFKRDASGEKYLRSIKHVWGVNAQNELVEVPVKAIKCLNNDFRA